jgi:hypothetical protein
MHVTRVRSPTFGVVHAGWGDGHHHPSTQSQLHLMRHDHHLPQTDLLGILHASHMAHNMLWVFQEQAQPKVRSTEDIMGGGGLCHVVS